mgnify:CR=1
MKAKRREVRRLQELLRESQVYLALTNLITYIAKGCDALRRPQQSAINDIKNLITTLPEPTLTEDQLRNVYTYLTAQRKCQEKGFATWGEQQRSGAKKPKSNSGKKRTTLQVIEEINEEGKKARRIFESAWVPKNR